MADFSTISQDPQIRALVQDGVLERAFHDGLFPRLMFRGEATPVIWDANIGDSQVFTGAGLIKPKMRPLVPGTDPTPSTYSAEQWDATLNLYADSIDTHMQTSIAAIADLFLRNAHQLGASGAQSLNRLVRNRLYNAAMAGWTVADGAQNNPTTLRVKRLNGFTKARRPDLSTGSAVRFQAVSANNPLSVTVLTVGGEVTGSVTAFTPDNSGDELGPGTITFSAPLGANVADRAYVFSSDRTNLVRMGGGNSAASIGPTDLLTLSGIRAGVARFRNMNVPEHPDGRFHCHVDPTGEAQVFSDSEFNRLLQSLPDYFMYKQMSLGELLGCAFFRNSECPQPETVDGGATAAYSLDDPFGGELFADGTTAGTRVHRALFTANTAVFEYYQDLSKIVTEAGITGRIGEPRITNNGIEVMSDRIQLILRAPLNRLQDMVSTSWKFVGDWPVRTDAATGDVARYKRTLVIEYGE